MFISEKKISLSIDGQLDCVSFLAIMNIATEYVGEQTTCQHSGLLYFGYASSS